MKARIVVFAGVLVATGALAQRNDGPFTAREAELLDTVWPEIRQADDFDDIDWRGLGLAGPPGDFEAREIMEENWDELRKAADFDDIDWREIRRSSRDGFFNRDSRERERRGSQIGSAFGGTVGPFTRQEAAVMREVWPEIRVAAEFEDINWRSVGLSGAPGDREARRVMSANWESLRTAADFDQIDWDRVGRRSR